LLGFLQCSLQKRQNNIASLFSAMMNNKTGQDDVCSEEMNVAVLNAVYTVANANERYASLYSI